MWRVFPVVPRAETTDLRNGNIMIIREMKSVGSGRLVMSSHDTLDAVRVGTRLLASRKRTLPEVKKLAFRLRPKCLSEFIWYESS